MRRILALCAIAVGLSANGSAMAQTAPATQTKPLVGAAAFAADWRAAVPGTQYLIRPSDLPKPFATQSGSSSPETVPWRAPQAPKAPAGFKVELFAKGLETPRTIRVAPNGDIFVVESGAGRVRVFKPDGTMAGIFALRLQSPYGLAFYPPNDPQYVYIAETNRLVRYPYKVGDTKASGSAEMIARLPGGGHWTRDVVFSPDGKQMFIAIGSASNVAEGLSKKSADQIKAFEAKNGIGAAWDGEEGRAGVFVADPDGKNMKAFATGIRNCSGLAIEPMSGTPWCATNERDGLGDNLPPDYITHLEQGRFYGWPWFYIGANPDPRHGSDPRPDLASMVTVPDVLIQAHSAPLSLAFYHGNSFPPDYVGDAFVGLHGSWNRGKPTGYKVVRARFENGKPTGVYEDFLTGFVISDQSLWGRPVGVAVAADGSLLVSEDESGTVWRVSKQ